uniref:Putative BTB_POZ domain-containing protein n=1 Tax=Moumouvirus sp. 'Monve' TaxID=1128131 RepID=H2ED64_9VIRU|nr:putative BTB_POZ domain-containing protein [Moumouvirus Monve]
MFWCNSNDITEIIYKNSHKLIEMKYNKKNLILILTEKNIAVYSLIEKRIINEFYCDLDYVDFVSEEIIVGSKIKNGYTNVYVYNIITGILIKQTSIDLMTGCIKFIPARNLIKDKLSEYLGNLNN